MNARQLRQICLAALAAVLVSLGACTPGPPEASSAHDAAMGRDVGVDASQPTRTVTIATFNVRRLFDTICDTNRCASSSDWEQTPTEAQYEARIAEVAAAIDGLDADIVLLQEIEKQSVLDDLNDAVSEHYSIAILGETGERTATVDTAVLARGQLVDSKGYRDFDKSTGGYDHFARQLLRVDLETEAGPIIVFSAHFVSKRSDSGTWRTAEAKQARQIVDQVAAEHDDALMVLGGDLNDTPDSDTLKALTQGDGALARVAQDRDLSQIYTYVWRSRQEDIDHLLLAPTSGGAYVSGSAQSHNDRAPHAGLGGSDHGALVARFEMR